MFARKGGLVTMTSNDPGRTCSAQSAVQLWKCARLLACHKPPDPSLFMTMFIFAARTRAGADSPPPPRRPVVKRRGAVALPQAAGPVVVHDHVHLRGAHERRVQVDTQHAAREVPAEGLGGGVRLG